MKNITLMDIMESLNGDNMEDAETALHEWFVDAAKKVHAQTTGQVDEDLADNADPSDPQAWAAGTEKFVNELQTRFDSMEEGSEKDELGEFIIDIWEAIGYFKEGRLDAGFRTMPSDSLYREEWLGHFPDSFMKYQEQLLFGESTVVESEKQDYSEVELIDDDQFEVDDYISTDMTNGVPGGVEKDIEWSRTGIEGDVVWLLIDPSKEQSEEDDRNELLALAQKHGYTNPDFFGATHAYNDAGDDVDAIWAAFNVTGEPQDQMEAISENTGFDYSDIDLVDDDQYELGDMIDYDKPYGVEKGFEWSRTGIEGDVVWMSFGSQFGNPDYDDGDYDEDAAKAALLKIAAKLGYTNPDFFWLDENSEGQAAYWAAFNVTGEPQYQESISEPVATEPTFEDLVDELRESFAGLETVSDKLQNVEGAAVGEQGKLPVNTKDTVPHHKADDRLGGEAVEIKSKDHKGFELEKAPKTKDAPVKHHVQNSKDDLKKVSAPKGSLLNKKDSPENTQSPISGKGAKGLKK